MKNPLDPDKNYQVHNEEIEGLLKDIGTRVGSQIPKGWVFNLVIASVGEEGATFYISNMERDDSMNFLQELINKNRRASERYPEIKYGVKILKEWVKTFSKKNQHPSYQNWNAVADLVKRSQDYIDNV